MKDGETGLRVPEGDAAHAALLRHPNCRAALGRAARADATTRLSWAQTITAFASLYESARGS